MPFDSSNEGQYLTSQFLQHWSPHFAQLVKERLKAGFKQEMVRPPLDMTFAFPTRYGTGVRRNSRYTALPVVQPPVGGTSSFDTYVTTPAETTTPPAPTTTTPPSTTGGTSGTPTPTTSTSGLGTTTGDGSSTIPGTTSSVLSTTPTTSIPSTTFPTGPTIGTTAPSTPNTPQTTLPPVSTSQSQSESGSGSGSGSGSDSGSGSGSESGSGSDNCLLYGTLIWMADGSKKPIEEIRVGDRVRSLNVPDLQIDATYQAQFEWGWDRGSDVFRAVSATVGGVRLGRHDGFFLVNGRIKATFEHPFLVKRNDRWIFVSAELLRDTDVMLTSKKDGTLGEEPVESIEKVKGEAQTVSLWIPRRNLYVAEGVFTHNDLTSGAFTTGEDTQAISERSLTSASEGGTNGNEGKSSGEGSA